MLTLTALYGIVSLLMRERTRDDTWGGSMVIWIVLQHNYQVHQVNSQTNYRTIPLFMRVCGATDPTVDTVIDTINTRYHVMQHSDQRPRSNPVITGSLIRASIAVIDRHQHCSTVDNYTVYYQQSQQLQHHCLCR